MTKQTQQTINEVFESAPQIQNFLDGDYFKAVCELGALSHLKQEFYVPDTSSGLFLSLFQRHVFKKAQKENGAVKVEFNMVNRYLYNYNKISRTYSTKKEENYNLFIQRVKELCETKNFTLFSLTPVTSVDELADALGQ